MFWWWGAKKQRLIAFGEQVAEDLVASVPLNVIDVHLSGKSKKATRRFEKAVDRALAEIGRFKAEQHPGVYGKAKLHQVFAIHLKTLGYPPELADEINTFILTKTP